MTDDKNDIYILLESMNECFYVQNEALKRLCDIMMLLNDKTTKITQMLNNLGNDLYQIKVKLNSHD